MKCSTTASLHDLHIIDNANNIVRWHRMAQCPVCLQAIPYGMYRSSSSRFQWEFLDDRRMIGSKVLHSGCVVCAECQKSIGEGAFEQVD